MMKKSRNKTDSDITGSEKATDDHELDQLAEALCVRQVKKKSPDEDPFDDYMEDIQAKFHSDPHRFKSRLSKGYEVLLQQLQADGATNPNQSA